MRYLNKITFINSAAIRYAEISLDGNVHFIGTQGVGKSTVLRAVLFFYNADTQKLGISKEKKLFAEYYLPYANSYIVYEVARETGPFCVMLSKSQGRVFYRFIDSGYRREHYLSEDGKAAGTWDNIRSVLDRQGIGYSRKIDRYEEYRDILYGNTEGKRDFRKYALLESRQYQSIARTIQNVFLNSRLEAEFIKQTIIRSLNEEDVQINLQTYQYELKGFEEQLADIRQFRQSAQQADNISTHRGVIRVLGEEKNSLSRKLARALREAQDGAPVLAREFEAAGEKRARLIEKSEDVRKRFENKKEKVQAEISVLNDKLRTAKEKFEHYRDINIEEIIGRVSRKDDLEREVRDLESERELLTARFKEITLKFGALEKELDNRQARFENALEKRTIDREAEFLREKERIHEQAEKLIRQMEKQYETALREAEEAHARRISALQALKEKKAALRHKRFHEEEIGRATGLIAELKGKLMETENRVERLKDEAETLQRRWETEEKGVIETHEVRNEKLEEELSRVDLRIGEIDRKLRNTKDSFYGWLNEHSHGWEDTIGMVCDEGVLFQGGLSPAHTSGDRDSFYGVTVDLSGIDRTVKTVADYEKERADALSEADGVRGRMGELLAGREVELERLKKKYGSRLRENQEQRRMSEYHLQQTRERLKGADLAMQELLVRAEEEKKVALQSAASEIDHAAGEELKARELVEKTKDEIRKQRAAREKDRNHKIEEESLRKGEDIARLNVERESYLNEHSSRRAAIEAQKQAELSDKGADTSRIREVEDRLAVIGEELRFIESRRDTVAVYRQDKGEFIDRTDEFKQTRRLHERQLEQEEQKYLNQKEAFDRELGALDKEMHGLSEALEKIREDLDEFEKFRQWTWFSEVSEIMGEAGAEYQTGELCVELISRIKEKQYLVLERMKELRELTNKFLGRFSAQNIFQFRINLIADEEYLVFSDDLGRFIEDDRISEYEKRVNERYAEIIKLIAKEITELISREGEIQGIIGKINRDITEKNFVGVIQKIELKLDESENRVVQILKMIKEFNDENGLMLGVANLFSHQDQDSKNKRAVDLLTQLVKEIAEHKRDYISLSDSFELKFRIIENQNDSGWVERLSNVGSEGTDILVKAMINIMLLNVFKEGASKRFKDFKLHCVMDEIGRLHPSNVRGILKFANDRNILLINGSPTESDALAYRHIYKLEKDKDSVTRVKRIITQHSEP